MTAVLAVVPETEEVLLTLCCADGGCAVVSPGVAAICADVIGRWIEDTPDGVTEGGLGAGYPAGVWPSAPDPGAMSPASNVPKEIDAARNRMLKAIDFSMELPAMSRAMKRTT